MAVTSNQPATSASPAASATPTATPIPEPDPGLTNSKYSLTIPTQRARDYAENPVTAEQAPTDAGGFRRGLISYVSDGLKIYAQVSLPATPRPAAGYPVLLLARGYINPGVYTNDEAFYSDFAAEYAKRGFLVIKPDLRGHGNSWGLPEGAYFSSGYAADILNLTASLPRYAEANPDRVALFGHSMGGHIALDAALVRPNYYKALILAAPATGKLLDQYYNWTAYSDFADPVTFGIRQRVVALFGEPAQESQFWREVDAYNYLADLKTPVQINHASNDDAVPYRFSVDLTAALQAAGKTVTFDTYEAGHSFPEAARPRLLDSSTSFINAALSDTKTSSRGLNHQLGFGRPVSR